MYRKLGLMNVTFITGNPQKAEFMAKYLDYPVEHQKIELDEIQSLDQLEITEHKARQAYEKIKKPVIVEDIGLYFSALGRLPGPLIRWFLEEIGNDGMCRILNSYDNRGAVAKVCAAYFDGTILKTFEGEVSGHISDKPYGDDGFGWNCIFVPEGANKTYAQMDGEETQKYSLRTRTVYPVLKGFLDSLDKA